MRRGPAMSALSGNELLPAVDVIRRTSKRRVAHDVNRQRRDVRGSNDTPDWQYRPQLVAPLVEVVTKKCCRKRCVDEACRDQIDADRCKLERQTGDECRERHGNSRRDCEASARATCAGAAHE